MTRIRRVAPWLLLLPVVVLLSGCFRVALDADVSSDDTVSGTLVMALKDDVVETLPQQDGSVQDELVKEGCDLPNETKVPYHEDGYTGVKCTFADVPLEQFSGDMEGGLSLTRDGDDFHLTGTLDLKKEMATDADEGLDLSGALDDAQVRFAFTFPGKVDTTSGRLSNGDRTVTFTPNDQSVVDIQATASAKKSAAAPLEDPLSWVLAGIALVVLLLVIALIVILVRHRKQDPPPPPPNWSQGPPPPGWNPPPGYGQPEWNPPQQPDWGPPR